MHSDINERTLGIIFAVTVFLSVFIGRGLEEGIGPREKEASLEAALLRAEPEVVLERPQPLPFPEVAPRSVTPPPPTPAPVPAPAGPPPPPAPTPAPQTASGAPIYLAGDLLKEENILSRKDTERWPIASITKLMTTVVALENIGREEIITITPYALSTEGDTGFKLGETYTATDLVKAMLVVSSNDAAAALENFYGKEAFIELMNKKAASLGMRNTNFAEATGLSSVNQSTAYDIKALVRYFYRHYPDIFRFSTLPTATIAEVATGAAHELTNINTFAGQADFMGGKTGYIDESRGNLVSVFLRSGTPIVFVVLGAEDRFAETKKIVAWFDAAVSVE